MPSELPAGLLYLEVQRGSFLGPALPLLVAPEPALALEAAIMLAMTQPADRQGLTVDLGSNMRCQADHEQQPRYNMSDCTADREYA